MLKKVFLALVVTALPAVSFAQGQTQEEAVAAKGGVASDSVTACAHTYTSGSGHNLTQYCVTANGNITQFSRGGTEFINAGALSEGYGVCDFVSGAQYFDYADNESGNWGATSVLSSTPTLIKLLRNSSDGIWTLTQTISKVAASGSAPGAAKVVMALKNNTAVARGVYLLRHADVDANATSGDDNFDYSLDTAFGLQPGFGGGLSISNGTFIFPYEAHVRNTFAGPAPCTPTGGLVNPGPFHGDGSIGALYVINVPAHGTKTVTVTYKPI